VIAITSATSPLKGTDLSPVIQPRRRVLVTSEHGVRAVGLDTEISEHITAGFAQATRNGDPIAVGPHVSSIGRT
jgi:hypothetical protein